MHYLKVVIIIVMFVSAHTAMAGRVLFEDGTIKSVDVENNTFTVELDNSGITKTYSFPDAINFVDDGVALVDKSAFKLGQSVRLKLEVEKSRFANPLSGTNKEYTLKGLTVE